MKQGFAVEVAGGQDSGPVCKEYAWNVYEKVKPCRTNFLCISSICQNQWKSNVMFFSACSANDSPWVKIIKITLIKVFALISLLVFAREPSASKQE